MNAVLGFDLGSSSIKAVVLDAERKVLTRMIQPTSLLLERDCSALRERLRLELPGVDLDVAVATGYGRNRMPCVAETRPEIICHARGVFHEFPFESSIIDIGGQDNKVIRMAGSGTVLQFRMNTKCAAGTGSFLEEIAVKARLPLEEIHDLAGTSTIDSPINSFCTVFAMTEVLKRIMEGEKLADLARGVYLSIAERIRELYRASPHPLILTGGVIHHNPLLRELLPMRLGREVLFPSHPQYTGAMGAALFAHEIAFAGRIPAEVSDVR
jgi:predicted CoA-substrate-specific enzyme activase